MIHTFAVRLAAVYVFLLLVALGGLGVALGAQNETLYEADLHTRLLGEARAVAVAAAPLFARAAPLSETQALAQALGDGLAARVTLIAPDGVVRGDSEQDPRVMDNHRTRPEVQAALLPTPGMGESVRFSNTLKRNLHYLAVPIHAPDEPARVVGVARVALANAALDQARAALWTNLLGTALVILVPTLLLAILVARGISRPLTELGQVARRIGMGDLAARAHGTTRDELGQLAGEINTMAERLADTVRRRTSERNEMAAVLAHLSDGIVVTNADGEITGINPAAARLFAITPEAALHRSFIQIARDHELYAALRACLGHPGTGSRVETTVGRYRVAATFTAVPATDAYGAAGLVVLQDVTELRYLERARRDFVANVSHELRTPLAALKLLVETLETAVHDDPDSVPPFLQKMQVELDDLTQLVQELLELSRIESGEVQLQLQEVPVGPLMTGVVSRLQPMAERKQIALVVQPPDPTLPLLRVDPTRIEQVLRNLVHNAIKFTGPQGTVTVGAEPHPDGVAICVRDTGIGIEPEDLPRVFERFYKADKARAAGGEGGTGLGLAVAKHLVRAHGGDIWAESTPGRGSTFCFSLPSPPGQPPAEPLLLSG